MQFGKPLAANQLVQKKLADMLTEVCDKVCEISAFVDEQGSRTVCGRMASHQLKLKSFLLFVSFIPSA